ncbi:MAG: PAS domain-containing protein [Deltaproteobacteria bacterium]|nr:PAS domain-containing protein [Deltaproteobacteria bacterium]
MGNALAAAIVAIGDALRLGGDVLAASAEAARLVSGARAARVIVDDGRRVDERTCAPEEDPDALVALVSGDAGLVVEAPLVIDERTRGALVVVSPTRADLLPALKAHVELALAHVRLTEEASSTRSIYRTLVEQLPAVTYYRSLDAPGRPSYASPQLSTLLGYAPEELEADPDLWKKRVHPDDVARVRAEQAVYQPERAAHPMRAEYRMVRRDGRVVWIENHAHTVRDEAGRARFVLGLLFDITERKQLEEQLRHAQKMEAIGKLAGGVAHDFNNLLSVVLTYGQSIAGSLPEADPRRAEAREIVRAGDRARALTQQLLAFGRRQMLAPRVLELAHVAERMRAFFRRALGEDIELVLDTMGSRGRVKADPAQLEQVLVNLAVNAREAMPHGGTLTVTVDELTLDAAPAARPDLAPGRYARLSMRDTGPGMDAETTRRVFEPFFTTKDPTRNSGLGLATALGIAEQSGGTLTVTSERGRGSTFALLLPICADTEPAPAPRTSGPLPRGSETVLLAEDDEQVRRLVQTFLERLGYAVLPCVHGEHALETAGAHDGPIHLLLTDVVMPRLGGFELARRMAALRPTTRVLYMSGYNDEAVSRHGAPDGAPILAKPFAVGELARRLRELLDAAPDSEVTTG